MNYADIKYCDVANGKGIRVSLFVSGCTHHCKGCFNEETWDFSYGQPFTTETLSRLLEYIDKPHIAGLSLLGGEPFEYVNQKGLLPVLRAFKERFPEKNVWCYTGYLFDQDIMDDMISKWPETEEMIQYIDILVDGEFIEELKNPSLQFKGSSNQRIIDVKASLSAGKLVLWKENPYAPVEVKLK